MVFRKVKELGVLGPDNDQASHHIKKQRLENQTSIRTSSSGNNPSNEKGLAIGIGNYIRGATGPSNLLGMPACSPIY